jgi:hypothetical protein
VTWNGLNVSALTVLQLFQNCTLFISAGEWGGGICFINLRAENQVN